jgi:hypothetical protein
MCTLYPLALDLCKVCLDGEYHRTCKKRILKIKTESSDSKTTFHGQIARLLSGTTRQHEFGALACFLQDTITTGAVFCWLGDYLPTETNQIIRSYLGSFFLK